MCSNTSWSAPTSLDEVRRRAGGRAKYNALRQVQALLRRREVLRLLLELGLHPGERGTAATLARRLGVHRSTIGRDLLAILEAHAGRRACPVCGAQIVRSAG